MLDTYMKEAAYDPTAPFLASLERKGRRAHRDVFREWTSICLCVLRTKRTAHLAKKDRNCL